MKIRTSSEKPTSNMAWPGSGLAHFVALFLLDLALDHVGLLILRLVVVAHALLEALDGGAQVSAEGLQFLGAEQQHDDYQDDQQFFQANAHRYLRGPVSPDVIVCRFLRGIG